MDESHIGTSKYRQLSIIIKEKWGHFEVFDAYGKCEIH